MYIRAGIIYQLINGYISKSICKELIYWSDYVDNNSFYYDMYYILVILESDLDYQAPIDFDLEIYYPGKSEQILSIFGEYEIQAIYDAISFYVYEYRVILEEEKMQVIPGNPTSTWFGTIGKDMETTTKIVLEDVYGFSIGYINRSYYNIPGTNIHLAGKADGYITSSPGGIYNGFIFECKYVHGRCKVDKFLTQIACYNKIYGKSVLLAIITGQDIKLYSYTSRNLEKYWDNKIKDKLIEVCSGIDNKILVKNVESVPKYIEFMMH